MQRWAQFPLAAARSSEEDKGKYFQYFPNSCEMQAYTSSMSYGPSPLRLQQVNNAAIAHEDAKEEIPDSPIRKGPILVQQGVKPACVSVTTLAKTAVPRPWYTHATANACATLTYATAAAYSCLNFDQANYAAKHWAKPQLLESYADIIAAGTKQQTPRRHRAPRLSVLDEVVAGAPVNEESLGIRPNSRATGRTEGSRPNTRSRGARSGVTPHSADENPWQDDDEEEDEVENGETLKGDMHASEEQPFHLDFSSIQSIEGEAKEEAVGHNLHHVPAPKSQKSDAGNRHPYRLKKASRSARKEALNSLSRATPVGDVVAKKGKLKAFQNTMKTQFEERMKRRLYSRFDCFPSEQGRSQFYHKGQLDIIAGSIASETASMMTVSRNLTHCSVTTARGAVQLRSGKKNSPTSMVFTSHAVVDILLVPGEITWEEDSAFGLRGAQMLAAHCAASAFGPASRLIEKKEGEKLAKERIYLRQLQQKMAHK